MLAFRSSSIISEAKRRKQSLSKLPVLLKIAQVKAEKILTKETLEFLKAFDRHPITREIQAGPAAKNTSGTLGGYGNLFSFIGFEYGSDPISKLREVLASVSLGRGKQYDSRWNFVIKLPTKSAIENVTKMPWSSESWAYGVETHISGLGQFQRTKVGSGAQSRSGGGYQTQDRLRNSEFAPRAYLSELLAEFKAKVNRIQAVPK